VYNAPFLTKMRPSEQGGALGYVLILPN